MIHLAYDAGVVRPGTIAAGIDSGGEIRLDLKKYPVLHASTAALSFIDASSSDVKAVPARRRSQPEAALGGS